MPHATQLGFSRRIASKIGRYAPHIAEDLSGGAPHDGEKKITCAKTLLQIEPNVTKI
jgi:hypothetical protein